MKKIIVNLTLLSTFIFAFCHAELIRPVNLGDTSFFDGLMFPQGGGWYFLSTSDLYGSSSFLDNRSKKIKHSPTIFVATEIPQFIYFSHCKPILNARIGLNLVIPIVASFNIGPQPNILNLTQGCPGLSDTYVGGFLQWDNIMRNGKPFFGHRLELATFLPTGNYDRTKTVNAGTNTWSLSTYWAATILPTEKLEISTRIHYLFYNSKNHHTKIRAGRAFHFNLVSSYGLTESFRIGVNSYYLKQVSKSTLNGKRIPDSNECVFAIGPGALFVISKNTYLTFNFYREVYARNRFSGSKGVIELTHYFENQKSD